MAKEIKYYDVIRIVKEVYQVAANSKQEALDNAENPNTITVIKEEIEDGILWYTLAEKLPSSMYSSEGFIPLSDICETEFERNYNKELV